MVNGLTAQERSAAQAQAPPSRQAGPGSPSPRSPPSRASQPARACGRPRPPTCQRRRAGARSPRAATQRQGALLEAALAAAARKRRPWPMPPPAPGRADAAIFQAQAGLLDDVGLITDTRQPDGGGPRRGPGPGGMKRCKPRPNAFPRWAIRCWPPARPTCAMSGSRALRHMEPSLAGDS